MQLVAALAALGALVAPAVAYPHAPMNETLVDVQLTAVGNTMVKATITNKGDSVLNMLKFNTIMDENPTRKVMVFQDGAEVPFTGMMPRYLMSDLTEEFFTTLAPQASVEHSFDIATTHDLSAGGKYVISASGAIPTAEEYSTTITSTALYESNELHMEIDGTQAAAVEQAMKFTPEMQSIHSRALQKRTKIVGGSCNQNTLRATQNALGNSARLAQAASRAASQNAAKFQEYFRTNDANAKQRVIARLNSVARESSSANGGSTTYYCSDTVGGCKPRVLAYTLPSRNLVVNCPIYYNLPPLTKQCHAQDQATTTLHEFTHNPAVASPHCQDYAYGYQQCISLPAAKAVQNADNYALFANGMFYSLFTIIF
ncbi:metalloproteinase, putative [Trichophyton verrucosum HKI 0517]|uniref:Probable neutral protease 2 homolog TRV_02539 n=1 Tax=Trichophyton verrucosum (strain HKI 0517) TaxID=663202 RepID=NPIID_TRIVH|nr:metalloproteinase, putative [Trichophyton verrucosum HKI 0517]D4D616.1 RecName: Full=Probable neutral protease 2 homolog TRV_02539; AltName: Full=Deuterolysin TRV_02539; Flags: Precursor [Trichophyton verrucosum HKI 0517]EFE42695.1 metalloproteinase, putative [Trichophyton verrucosum HKI 0517]